MEKIKNLLGLVLMGLFCAYTVDGLAQESSSTNSKKEIIVIKKEIDDNGVEKIEKKVFSSDDLSDEEMERIMSSELGSDVEVNTWTKDNERNYEIVVDDRHQVKMIEDAELKDFLKENGLTDEDIANMDISIERSFENGVELSNKIISIVDKNGKKYKLETGAGEEMDLDGHSVIIMDQPKPKLGIMIGEHDGKGVMIDDVIPNSPADKIGLQKGDIIVAVGDEITSNTQQLLDALKKSNNQNNISFFRDGVQQGIQIEFTDFEFESENKYKVIKKYKEQKK